MMIHSASVGDLGRLKLYVAELGPNAKDYNGRTPLHVAVDENRADSAILLMSMGADPHLRDAMGRSPMDAIVALEKDPVWRAIKFM